jgi:hypothetical protein
MLRLPGTALPSRKYVPRSYARILTDTVACVVHAAHALSYINQRNKEGARNHGHVVSPPHARAHVKITRRPW